MTINAKRLGLVLSGAAIAVAVPLGIAQSAQAHGGGFAGPHSGPTRVSDTTATTSGTDTTTASPTTSRTPCTRTTSSTPTTSSTDTTTATTSASASASASAAAVPRFGGRRH